MRFKTSCNAFYGLFVSSLASALPIAGKRPRAAHIKKKPGFNPAFRLVLHVLIL
uniref:Uncharacterized protein n=1 Tax=Salmonella phage vB_SEnST11_KE22 TaxID=3161173 RepID=A0AAU8GEJ0_9CAUD